MLSIKNLKEQFKSLSEKENYFLLSEVEPTCNHNFIEVSFKANKDSFEIIDLIQFGQSYKTINYQDVKELEIDSILVSIELKDGTVYLLHEVRTDIVEILKDFDKDCCITRYKIAEEDGETKYKTEHYFILEDFEVSDDEENNTVEIESEYSKYVIDYDDVLNIEEDYYGGQGSDRSVRIYLNDNSYITIESMGE